MTNYSVSVCSPHYPGFTTFVTVTVSVSWDVCELIFPEDSHNLLPLAHLNQVGAENKLATITGAPHHRHCALREEGSRTVSTIPKTIGIDNRATLNFTIQCLSFTLRRRLDAHPHDLT
jgi:hypothetical protein